LKAADLGTVQDAIKGTVDIPSADAVDQVNWLVQDSETKCKNFTDSLFAQTAGTNVILDFVSTVASALGAVFTPLSTVHAVSAVSAVSSGTKTSISTEYLNALSINHVTQAIQSTYGSDMQKYIQFLQSIPEENRKSVHVFDARSTILTYHAECSLASAEASIGNALQPAQSPAPGNSKQVVVSYTVTAGETAVHVASGLLNAINNDASLKAAGVSAAEQGGANPNGTLILTLPSTVTFSQPLVVPTGAETVTINKGPPATLQVSGTPRSGNISITVSIPAPSKESTVNVTYTVAAGEAAIQVASGLLNAINRDATLKAAGVSAAEQGGENPNGTLILTLPSTVTLSQPVVVPIGGETVTINKGPPTTLQVGGTPQAGTITIMATVMPGKPPAPAVAGRAPR